MTIPLHAIQMARLLALGATLVETMRVIQEIARAYAECPAALPDRDRTCLEESLGATLSAISTADVIGVLDMARIMRAADALTHQLENPKETRTN